MIGQLSRPYAARWFLVVVMPLLATLCVSLPNPPWARGYFPHVRNDSLGAEYRNIAEAIRAGQGFADPFEVGTGPTAWMPPALPLLQAGLYWLAGDNRGVAAAGVVAIKTLVLILAGAAACHAFDAARPMGVGGLTALPAVAFAAFVIADFPSLFLQTSDEWLIMLAVTAVYCAFVRIWPASGRPPHLAVGGGAGAASLAKLTGLGVLGGAAALTSPVLGFSWGILAAASLWRRPGLLVAAAAVAALTIAPWCVRNYVTFGRLIPIKSNLGYELWLAQCVDADGVLDQDSLSIHPWVGPGPERTRYREQGEVAFVDASYQLWKADAAEHPMEVVRRTANRLAAATLYLAPPRGEVDADAAFLLFRRLLHPLPLLGACVLLAMRRPLPPALAACVLLYVSYLLPYVAASYYERYSVPLLPLKAILVAAAVDAVLHRSGRSAPRSMP